MLKHVGRRCSAEPAVGTETMLYSRPMLLVV